MLSVLRVAPDAEADSICRALAAPGVLNQPYGRSELSQNGTDIDVTSRGRSVMRPTTYRGFGTMQAEHTGTRGETNADLVSPPHMTPTTSRPSRA